MAQIDRRDNRSDPLNRFKRVDDAPYEGHVYEDPTRAAIYRFYTFICSDYEVMDESDPTVDGPFYAQTEFYRSGRKVACLLDFAHVWLIEGHAARWCPTFESWLIFLIAFADEVHRKVGPKVGRDEDDWEYRDPALGWKYILTGQNNDYGPPDKPLETWDLMYWGSSTEDGEVVGYWLDILHVGEAYQHPVLNRNIYERARALYLERTSG